MGNFFTDGAVRIRDDLCAEIENLRQSVSNLQRMQQEEESTTASSISNFSSDSSATSTD
jgi:hypothetical protein